MAPQPLSSNGDRPFAVVTGGSSGIGLELAREFLTHGYDVLLAAHDGAHLEAARMRLAGAGGTVTTLTVDLRTREGVDDLWARIQAEGRPLDAIALNAGVGVGGDFARQTSLVEELDLIQLNVVAVVYLAKLAARDMVARGYGRILITSSISSFLPSPFEAVYGASKAFVQSFSASLHEELKDAGVTVTALLPGPTETNFFQRAHMDDTKVGTDRKDDPAKVARMGFEALMEGRERVTAGSPKNKLFALAGRVLPERVKSKLHRRMSEPGSAH